MPIRNLSPSKLYEFITSDFEGAWNAIAKDLPPGRGNMMFAREAMLLLEWAARCCVALVGLSEALALIEPRYFTALPGPCANNRDFVLPSDPSKGQPQAQLLWALFDMVRNGLVHQGQQILVRLPDHRTFGVIISGVRGPLYPPRGRGRHLNYRRTLYGDTFIYLAPDRLYLDFKVAIAWSGLLKRKRLPFRYLERGSKPKKQLRPLTLRGYKFSSRLLRQALAAGGHNDLSGSRSRSPTGQSIVLGH